MFGKKAVNRQNITNYNYQLKTQNFFRNWNRVFINKPTTFRTFSDLKTTDWNENNKQDLFVMYSSEHIMHFSPLEQRDKSRQCLA